MSHFTCFLVGNPYEEMPRFDENGTMYFKPREIGDIENLRESFSDPELIKEFKKETPSENHDFPHFYKWYHGIHMCTSREELEEKMGEQEPCFLVEDGDVKESWYFSNPDAKFDYFGIVGMDPFVRFSVELRMKDGSKASRGLVKDIDIDATLKAEQERYREDYRKVMDKCGKIDHTPWSEFLKRVDSKEITLDEARALYQMQEGVNRFLKVAPFGNPDAYLCTEDEYTENNASLPFFSANIKGKWLENGEMGWFGVVLNEKNGQDWGKEIVAALRQAQEDYPEEQFYILDCHI